MTDAGAAKPTVADHLWSSAAWMGVVACAWKRFRMSVVL